MCCDSWGCKQSDTTERLNWTELSATWEVPPPKMFWRHILFLIEEKIMLCDDNMFLEVMEYSV